MVEREDLLELARVELGREVVAVAGLRGGTRKGVYRLTFADSTTAVLYTWDPATNYWPEAAEDPVFTTADGIDLFEAARSKLQAIGVRTPHVHFADRSGKYYPADLAVVEDLRPEHTDCTLPVLGDALRAMAKAESPTYGKPGSPQDSCEQVVLARALRHLDAAAARVERIAAVRGELERALHTMAAAITPRTRYGLVHGELGPEHVLTDSEGLPVIIDVEGLTHFDVEWEHVFLRLRFGAGYHRWLVVDGLDPARMDFYQLALHLSLIEGPLRLLDGDFPHRDGMLEIVEHNIGHALELLR